MKTFKKLLLPLLLIPFLLTGCGKQSEIVINQDNYNEDGTINEHNLERDTQTTDKVLIAEEFFYFGQGMIDISAEYGKCVHHGIGHSCPEIEKCQSLWEYLCENYEMGLIDMPRQFKSFVRYDGIS